MKNKVCTIILLLVLLAGAAFAQQAPAEPQSVQDAIAVVVVGDIYGFLNSAGGVTAAVSPAWNGQWLRQMLGSQLGDPQLEGIQPASGMTVLFWPNNTYSAYIEVDPAKMDQYIAAAQQQGRKLSKADTLLVNGTAADSVNLKFAPAAKTAFLSGTGAPTLKAFINMPKVMQLVEPQLQMLQQSAELQAQQANQNMSAEEQKAQQLGQRIMIGEMLAFASMGKQLQTMEFELKTAKSNIMLDMSITAMPDTNLATFLSSQTEDPLAMMQDIPDSGAVRMAMAYNADAMKKLVDAEMGPVLQQMNLSAEEAKNFREYMDTSMNMYGGAFVMDYLIPDKDLLSGSLAYKIQDKDNALETMRKSIEQSQGLMKMYQGTGIKMDVQFQENAETYKGTAIHKYTMNMDMSQMAGMNAMTQMMLPENSTFDVAIVDNTLLYAMNEGQINSMIDAAKAGAHPQAGELGATELFGAGKQMYVDISVARLATFAKNFMAKMQAGMGGAQQQNPMDQFVALLQLVPPITMAGEWGQSNSGKMTLAVPVDLVGKVYQIAMMQMMQGMGGAQRQPQGGNTGGPQPF